MYELYIEILLIVTLTILLFLFIYKYIMSIAYKVRNTVLSAYPKQYKGGVRKLYTLINTQGTCGLLAMLYNILDSNAICNYLLGKYYELVKDSYNIVKQDLTLTMLGAQTSLFNEQYGIFNQFYGKSYMNCKKEILEILITMYLIIASIETKATFERTIMLDYIQNHISYIALVVPRVLDLKNLPSNFPRSLIVSITHFIPPYCFPQLKNSYEKYGFHIEPSADLISYLQLPPAPRELPVFKQESVQTIADPKSAYLSLFPPNQQPKFGTETEDKIEAIQKHPLMKFYPTYARVTIADNMQTLPYEPPELAGNKFGDFKYTIKEFLLTNIDFQKYEPIPIALERDKLFDEFVQGIWKETLDYLMLYSIPQFSMIYTLDTNNHNDEKPNTKPKFLQGSDFDWYNESDLFISINAENNPFEYYTLHLDAYEHALRLLILPIVNKTGDIYIMTDVECTMLNASGKPIHTVFYNILQSCYSDNGERKHALPSEIFILPTDTSYSKTILRRIKNGGYPKTVIDIDNHFCIILPQTLHFQRFKAEEIRPVLNIYEECQKILEPIDSKNPTNWTAIMNILDSKRAYESRLETMYRILKKEVKEQHPALVPRTTKTISQIEATRKEIVSESNPFKSDVFYLLPTVESDRHDAYTKIIIDTEGNQDIIDTETISKLTNLYIQIPKHNDYHDIENEVKVLKDILIKDKDDINFEYIQVLK